MGIKEQNSTYCILSEKYIVEEKQSITSGGFFMQTGFFQNLVCY